MPLPESAADPAVGPVRRAKRYNRRPSTLLGRPVKTPSVPSLERALAILELLARRRAGLALPEIAAELHLPKSSVHCLLITLERHRYLQRHDESGRYRFGAGLFGLIRAGAEARA